MLETVLKCPSQWLTKHGLLSGFVATMLGVLVAFWFTGWGEHRALDSATKQRLHMAYLESTYNGPIALEIMHADASSDSYSIRVARPDTAAAAAVLEDANILAFLPNEKVVLLQAYVRAVATLNEALQVHQSLLVSAGGGPTSAEVPSAENIRENALNVAGMTLIIQEELKPYVDEGTNDREAIDRIRNRVREAKAEVLRGNVSLSKEE